MKRIVVSGAVLALAIAGVQAATAAPAVYKVTGGGQITEISEDTGRAVAGPGNTIAFNAHGLDEAGDAAKGQVQYIDRTNGTGQAQVRYHGYVTCVVSDGTMARIQGQMRGETDDPTDVDFTIDVIDNGQGSAAEMDMIAFRLGAPSDAEEDGGDEDGDSTCDLDDDFNAEGALGRGNVKIHEAKGGAAPESTSTAKGKGRS